MKEVPRRVTRSSWPANSGGEKSSSKTSAVSSLRYKNESWPVIPVMFYTTNCCIPKSWIDRACNFCTQWAWACFETDSVWLLNNSFAEIPRGSGRWHHHGEQTHHAGPADDNDYFKGGDWDPLILWGPFRVASAHAVTHIGVGRLLARRAYSWCFIEPDAGAVFAHSSSHVTYIYKDPGEANVLHQCHVVQHSMSWVTEFTLAAIRISIACWGAL